MINTALGRAFLIFILLILSGIHKILGVVCVLLIVILFNNSDSVYLEGMTTPTVPGKTTTTTSSPTNNPMAPSPMATSPTTTTTTSSPSTNPMAPSPPTPPTTPMAPPPATSTTTTTSSPTASTPANVSSQSPSLATSASNLLGSLTNKQQQQQNNTAQEGFDLIGKERNIQRGRNSNSIPVNDFMRESTNVAPYEGSAFFSSYSSV